jgi:hypothetical protein
VVCFVAVLGGGVSYDVDLERVVCKILQEQGFDQGSGQRPRVQKAKAKGLQGVGRCSLWLVKVSTDLIVAGGQG